MENRVYFKSAAGKELLSWFNSTLTCYVINNDAYEGTVLSESKHLIR
jgi:hypothetical protein